MKKRITILVTVMAVSTILFSQVNLTNGLVGYYQFNEGTGTTTANAVSGNDVAPSGTLVNSPEWTDGKFGKGLKFTPESLNNVLIGSYNPSNGTNKLAVSVWVNYSGGTGYFGLCGKRDAWNADEFMWDICIDTYWNEIQFESYIADPDGKIYIHGAIDNLLVEEWHHFALNFDGLIGTMYIDGDTIVSDTMAFGSNAETSFVLGAAGSSEATFSGILDEFRFYNRTLTIDEIDSLIAYVPGTTTNNNIVSEGFGKLSQNFPNPAVNSTKLEYSLDYKAIVQLNLYDYTGKKLNTLVNSVKEAGKYIFEMNTENLVEGVYFYNLVIDGKQIDCKKMIIVR